MTNTQSRFASVVVDGVLGPCISVVPEASHEASRGSETETREVLGGTEEKRVDLIDLPSRQINEFSQKGNRKKN